MLVTCKALQVNYLPMSVAFKSGLVVSYGEGPVGLVKGASWKRWGLRRDLKEDGIMQMSGD